MIPSEALDCFQAAKFRFRLRAVDTLYLPEHQGSAFRGGFGRILRKVACPLGCLESCQRPDTCIYAYIFETPAPAGSQVLEKIPTAPRPFVIESPAEAVRVYDAGGELTLGLVLIGRAIDYLPYFVYAFEELGRAGLGRAKGRYRLEEVVSVPATGPPTTIFDSQQRKFTDTVHRFSLAQASGGCPAKDSAVTLHFVSPTQLHYEGRPAGPAAFHVLFRNVLRRVNFLNYFHCGGQLLDDPSELIQAACAVETVENRVHWKSWERYSARQDRRVPMAGFTGRVTYQGDLRPFWPWLLLGEWVHVGSAATFGLGQYCMEQGSGYDLTDQEGIETANKRE